MRKGYFFKTVKTNNNTFMIDITPAFLEYTYPCTTTIYLVLARIYQMYLYDFFKYAKEEYGAIVKENTKVEYLHRYYLVFDSEDKCDDFVSAINIQFYAWITRSPILKNNTHSEIFNKKDEKLNEK